MHCPPCCMRGLNRISCMRMCQRKHMSVKRKAIQMLRSYLAMLFVIRRSLNYHFQCVQQAMSIVKL